MTLVPIVAAVLMVAGLLLTPAAATPAEDAYIAARDAAIAKVKAAADAEPKNPTGGDDDKVIALDTQELAGLEKQLRAIVGPVAIKGLGGKSAINLDTLSEGDEGFGLLDGIALWRGRGQDPRDRHDRRLIPALAARAQKLGGQPASARSMSPRSKLRTSIVRLCPPMPRSCITWT